MPPIELSRSPVPAEAFDDYAGQWIAVREGEVVASGKSLSELDAQPEVRPDDPRFKVPEPDSHFF
jgi:hypothetical protein